MKCSRGGGHRATVLGEGRKIKRGSMAGVNRALARRQKIFPCPPQSNILKEYELHCQGIGIDGLGEGWALLVG